MTTSRGFFFGYEIKYNTINSNLVYLTFNFGLHEYPHIVTPIGSWGKKIRFSDIGLLSGLRLSEVWTSFSKNADSDNDAEGLACPRCFITQIVKLAIHYSRTTTKQGQNDEIRTYSEQWRVGVRHVSQTGFSHSLYTVRRICVKIEISSTNTKEFFIEKKKFVHLLFAGFCCAFCSL